MLLKRIVLVLASLKPKPRIITLHSFLIRMRLRARCQECIVDELSFRKRADAISVFQSNNVDFSSRLRSAPTALGTSLFSSMLIWMVYFPPFTHGATRAPRTSDIWSTGCRRCPRVPGVRGTGDEVDGPGAGEEDLGRERERPDFLSQSQKMKKRA